MPDNSMPDIYMSYTEADRPLARYVAGELQSRGASLRSHSLAECDYFLLIYSPRAVADSQIKAEIISVLVQDKAIAVLTVEPLPLTPPDFPFLVDDETTHFTLTAPEQAEATFNALAAHYGLRQQSLIPADTSLFNFDTSNKVDQSDATTEEQTDSLQSRVNDSVFPGTSADFDKILFRASELADERFGAALTLLLWLPRFANEYSRVLRGFRDHQLVRMRERWLNLLEKQAQAALQANDDSQIARLIEIARIADPQHPLSRKLQSDLRERRIADLWRRVKAQANREGWRSINELLDAMRAINPLDQRTLEAAENFQNEIECETLADVAERAATGGYNHAFAHLMQYIQQRCPDFKDTRNLLSNLQLTAELVEYLKPKHVLRGGGGVQTLAFSPDGTLLVSGGADGVLRLWDMEQAQQVARQSRDDGAILSLAYSPDGTLLVSASEAGVVRLWQMPEGREIMTIDEFSDRVTCVCFTPDGQGLICGSSSGAVQIVRIRDGLVLYDTHADVQAGEDETRTDRRHYYAITSLSLAQLEDGQTLLLTSSDDKTIKVWQLEDPPALTLLHSLAEHTMIVREAVFSETAPRMAASVGNDGLVCIWSPQTGELLKKLSSQTSNQVRAAAFVPRKSLLASGGTDRVVTFWDVDKTEPLRQLVHHEGSINALAFSRDGLWLASGSSDQKIVLWHL
jgi:hypothetical protein